MLQALVVRGLTFPKASAACFRLVGAVVAPQFYASVSTSSSVVSSTSSTDSTKKAKRPLTAYTLFVKQQFASIRAEIPGGKPVDTIRTAAARFAALSESAKEPYVSEAQKLRSAVAAHRAAIKEKNKKKMTSYMRFVTENFGKAKAMVPPNKDTGDRRFPFGDVSRHLSAMWKSLSDKEKLA